MTAPRYATQAPARHRTAAMIPDAQSMIYLGHIRAGARFIRSGAKAAMLAQGRVAIFIGANGEAAAYSYRHVDFDRHCRKHADSLVGVYEPSPSGEISDAADKALLADIRCHVLALPNKGAKAA